MLFPTPIEVVSDIFHLHYTVVIDILHILHEHTPREILRGLWEGCRMYYLFFRFLFTYVPEPMVFPRECHENVENYRQYWVSFWTMALLVCGLACIPILSMARKSANIYQEFLVKLAEATPEERDVWLARCGYRTHGIHARATESIGNKTRGALSDVEQGLKL